MEIIKYISIIAMPAIILLIITYSFIEKNNVFDLFVDGAKEGIKIVYNIFPTLLGLFISIGVLRASGILDLIINLISPIIELFNFPKEIMPLALLRPISGSASMAVATDIMKTYGVDTQIGKIASVIMGSTETTLYIIAIYSSCVKIKNTRGIIIPALIADFMGMVVATIICSFM